MSTTIAALATALGKASLCTIRVSGDDSFSIAKKVFKPANKEKDVLKQKGYTALFGQVIRGEKEIDDAVLLFFKAPKSYTGEDVVEISCHGGQVVASEVLKALYEAGAQPALAGEFTKRAFLNSKISLTQAEAVMEMINATTKQAMTAAKSALEGNLYKKAKEIRDDLLILAGHISAYTDFPEEDVDEVKDEEVLKTLTKNVLLLEKIIKNYDMGAKIKQGVNTAIVGKPNVGKSTLLNALSGFEKAIVTSVAGTTRDVIEQEVLLDNINLILQDTAGIRKTDDEVEHIGIQRSVEKLQNAQLVFCVFDGSEEITKEDVDLSHLCKSKNAIAIVNKQDLKQNFKIEKIKDCFKKIMYITAKDFYLTKEFKNTVLEVIGVLDIDTQVENVVNERQYEAVRIAYTALLDAKESFEIGHSLDIIGVCVDEALYSIYALTGEDASQEVIDEVFSKFCVGK